MDKTKLVSVDIHLDIKLLKRCKEANTLVRKWLLMAEERDYI